MKTFDPMNSGDDNSDFERQLRGMELRRPPAGWKALLLPEPKSVVWFPKPFLIGLAACWAVTAGFLVTKPEDALRSQPLLLPVYPSISPTDAEGKIILPEDPSFETHDPLH